MPDIHGVFGAENTFSRVNLKCNAVVLRVASRPLAESRHPSIISTARCEHDKIHFRPEIRCGLQVRQSGLGLKIQAYESLTADHTPS